ncbi:hypothetical protein A3Q56_08398, partial [Intoshia linei]
PGPMNKMADQLSCCCAILHNFDDINISLFQNTDPHCKEILNHLFLKVPISHFNKSAKAELIVVPKKLQDKLIEMVHSGPQACHPGVRAVISVISR